MLNHRCTWNGTSTWRSCTSTPLVRGSLAPQEKCENSRTDYMQVSLSYTAFWTIIFNQQPETNWKWDKPNIGATMSNSLSCFVVLVCVLSLITYISRVSRKKTGMEKSLWHKQTYAIHCFWSQYESHINLILVEKPTETTLVAYILVIQLKVSSWFWRRCVLA